MTQLPRLGRYLRLLCQRTLSALLRVLHPVAGTLRRLTGVARIARQTEGKRKYFWSTPTPGNFLAHLIGFLESAWYLGPSVLNVFNSPVSLTALLLISLAISQVFGIFFYFSALRWVHSIKERYG